MHRFKSSKSKRTSNVESTIVPTPLNIVVQDTEIICSPEEGWTVENSTEFPKVAKYLAGTCIALKNLEYEIMHDYFHTHRFLEIAR